MVNTKWVGVIFLVIILNSLSVQNVYSQNEGGQEKFSKDELALRYYLQENVRYPNEARMNRIEGEVDVTFLIRADGTADSISVVKGMGFLCDEEAIRLIKDYPKKYEVAEVAGEPVKSWKTVTVKFRIREEFIPPPPQPEPEMEGDKIFMMADVMPEFPGGMEGFVTYLKDNLSYPEEAKKNGISGKVYVKFVVKKDVSIGDAKVLKGLGGGCDEEAIRVIKNSPDWKPALMMGKSVSMWFTAPINFKL